METAEAIESPEQAAAGGLPEEGGRVSIEKEEAILRRERDVAEVPTVDPSRVDECALAPALKSGEVEELLVRDVVDVAGEVGHEVVSVLVPDDVIVDQVLVTLRGGVVHDLSFWGDCSDALYCRWGERSCQAGSGVSLDVVLLLVANEGHGFSVGQRPYPTLSSTSGRVRTLRFTCSRTSLLGAAPATRACSLLAPGAAVARTGRSAGPGVRRGWECSARRARPSPGRGCRDHAARP